MGNSPPSHPRAGAALPANGRSPDVLSQIAAGWTASLTSVVLLGFAIETVTGLWVLLAPFSILSQLQVIAHTAAGLLLLGPYAVYQWRHLRLWWAQAFSVVMLLGYAGMALTVVCLASGAVVTAEGWFGPRLSTAWDEIHLVTGIGLAVVVALHAGLAYVRRREALGRLAGFLARLRRRGYGLIGGLATLGGAIGLTAAWLPRVRVNWPLPSGYRLPAYAQQFKEYRGSPFAPSYARTSTGRLVNPAVLANSASCGTSGCHEQIYAEWEPDAHRFSAMNPPFLAVQKKFAHDRGAAETRYCAGCHDPISLFAGAKNAANVSLSAPGAQEGSSCVVCHSISRVDQRGNADYVLTPPRKYLGEATHGWSKRLSDFLIRAYPWQHLADYNRSVLHTPEFCGACHKQFIPEALNRFGPSLAQDTYDEWHKSHWNHPGHPDQTLTCIDCHMRLDRNSTDPSAEGSGEPRHPPGDGAHRDHGFIATNLFMPAILKLPHYREHDRLTREWIQGRTILPEIANVWPAGPAASIKLVAPASAAPGRTLAFRAVVRNRKAGHNFITGPLDLIRAWVSVRVTDARGAVVAEWGGLDPATGDIIGDPGVLHPADPGPDGGTMILEVVPLDRTGGKIVRHDLWRKAGGTGERVIFPGYADMQTYRCRLPAVVRGPLTITARLNFRRYRQEFLNLMVPDMERTHGVYQPTVIMDAAVCRVAIGRARRGPAAAGTVAIDR